MDQRLGRPHGIDLLKRAPWLLAPAGEIESGRRVVLESAETRHATGALRLRSGDPVVLTDGAGCVASGTIALSGRGAAEVVVHDVDNRPVPTSDLVLAVAVLAGAAMDLVVQKTVELGVERLVPVWCERSQMSPKRAATRIDHWHRVSRQALKQCHRAWAMELAPPTTLTALVNDPAFVHGIVAHPDGGTIDELPPGRVGPLLIGPEGGFTPDEEGVLEDAGWPRVRLGRYVLRAETAAIAGAAVLSIHQEGLHSTDV